MEDKIKEFCENHCPHRIVKYVDQDESRCTLYTRYSSVWDNRYTQLSRENCPIKRFNSLNKM